MTTKIYIGLALLLVMVSCKQELFTNDLAGFDPNSDLRAYEITLTGPGQSAGEKYLDLGSGAVYNYTQATEHPEKIDLIFLWGSSSAANLLSPNNTARLDGWATGKNINANWFVKNETKMIRLEKAAADPALYNELKSMADIKTAYATLKELAENQPDYSLNLHGEGIGLQGIQPGDILGFMTSKQVYAIAIVESLVTGDAGNIALRIKLDKSEEIVIDPIAPHEIYESYSFEIDQLGNMGGNSLIDLSTGNPFSVVEGYYSQHNIDAIFYQTDGDITIAAPAAVLPEDLNEDVIEIRSDWELRNETQFIRLKASTQTTEVFNNAYTNTFIKEAFEQGEDMVHAYSDYDVAVYGPGLSVSGLATGDVVLYHSVDRNVYGMIRITDSGPEIVKGQAKVNVYNKNELVPPVLKEFTNSGNLTGGAKYLNFKQATMYITEADGKSNAAEIDVISARGNNSGHNLVAVTSDAGLNAFSGDWRIRIRNEWAQQNDAELFGYRGALTPPHWWEMYHDLKEDETMWDVFQAETAGMTPSGRWQEKVAPADPSVNKTVIFLHSIDRKLLIALKVMNTTTSASITYRYKIIELEQ